MKLKTQTIKDFFEKILLSSERKPNLFESDRDKELLNSIFQSFQLKKLKLIPKILPYELFFKNVLIVL